MFGGALNFPPRIIWRLCNSTKNNFRLFIVEVECLMKVLRQFWFPPRPSRGRVSGQPDPIRMIFLCIYIFLNYKYILIFYLQSQPSIILVQSQPFVVGLSFLIFYFEGHFTPIFSQASFFFIFSLSRKFFIVAHRLARVAVGRGNSFSFCLFPKP